MRYFTAVTRRAGYPRPAINAVRAAFAEQDVDARAKIHTQADLATRLGCQLPPYLDLRACNLPPADQVLAIEPSIGLLPRNGATRADPGQTTEHGTDRGVEAADRQVHVNVTDLADLQPDAEQAGRRLHAALPSSQPADRPTPAGAPDPAPGAPR